MSAYQTCTTIYKDRDSLVEALRDLGYEPEVHEAPVSLYGYKGDQRPEKAHVVLRRSQVGSASNDVGFVRGADGIFTATISDYDSRTNFNERRQTELKVRYGYRHTLRTAKAKGYVLAAEKTEAGKMKLTLQRFS